MTSTIGPLLENCCDPCPSCGDGCKNTCSINIESTNPECLKVDTSECGVIKLEPKCPKVTYVEGGKNVTIEEVIPPDECYADGGDCDIKGGWKVNSTDEKVKACSGDTTPGYLSEKLEEGNGIIIEPQGCDGGENASLRISINPEAFPKIPDIPEITIDDSGSKLVSAFVSGGDKHHITIIDRQETTYDNMCCVGFKFNQDWSIDIDDQGNSVEPTDVYPWNLCTGNPEMATAQGIKILADGHYWVFGQLTVENNTSSANTFFNLGRGLLKIDGYYGERYVSTAKHGAYGRQVLLTGKDDIDISDNGEISSGSGEGQTKNGFDGPWMTFNIEAQLDLHAGDVLTLAYRPQSDMPASRGQMGYFRFVGQNDSSTKFNAIFGGTVLGVHWMSPTLFQERDGDYCHEF